MPLQHRRYLEAGDRVPLIGREVLELDVGLKNEKSTGNDGASCWRRSAIRARSGCRR
jgi:hypothetical protein